MSSIDTTPILKESTTAHNAASFAFNKNGVKSQTRNEALNLLDVVSLIKNPPAEFLPLFSVIKQKAATYYNETNESRKAQFKASLSRSKERLPFFIPSGFKLIGHGNNGLTLNSTVQIDIDFHYTGGDIQAKQQKHFIKLISDKALPFVQLAAISPTNYGLKIWLKTDLPSDATNDLYKFAQKQITEFLSQVLNVETSFFDALPIGKTCYLPFDPSLYFNPKASDFKVDVSRFNTEKEAEIVNEALRRENAKRYVSDGSTIANAAKFLIDNNINITESHNDYISTVAACINAFDVETGENIARQLCQASAKFNEKNFLSTFKSLSRSTTPDKAATGGTLIYHALKHGFVLPSRESIKAMETVLKPFLSIVLNEGEYLSDVLKPSNILQNCIINAGTGVGKTEFALNFDGKRIICVPTRKLAKRVQKRAIDKGIDAQLFYGGTNLENQNATCIVTTYSSLTALYPVFHGNGFTLFIDEIHNATTAANPSFMLKELRSVIDSMPYFSRVIGLTGTQIYNFHAALQLPTIEVKRDIITPLPYKVIRCKTRTATAAKLVKQSIDSERTPIVFLNNKGGKLAALSVAIKDTTGLTNEQILIVNADQSGELDFETLVNSGVIGDNIKLIITTSVFKEGNDIYNTGGFDLIIMSNLIASDKRQFRGRFRNTNDVTFTILKTAKKEGNEENPHFDAYKQSFSLRHFAEIAANEVNNLPTQYSRELHIKTASHIQSLPLYLDSKGGCKVCELYLSNTIANQQNSIEAANDTFEAQQMQAYGFTFEGVFNDTDELNAEIKEEMKAATVVSKEMVELDYIETLNSFENDRTIEPQTDAQKQAIDFVLTLESEGFNTPKALEIAKVSTKKSDRVKFLGRVSTAKKLSEYDTSLENDKDKTTKVLKDKTTKVLQAIQKDFVVGRKYTRDTFLKKLINCLKKDSRIDIFGFKKERLDKALKVVELVCNIKTIDIKREGKALRLYEITSFENVLIGCNWKPNNSKKDVYLVPF